MRTYGLDKLWQGRLSLYEFIDDPDPDLQQAAASNLVEVERTVLPRSAVVVGCYGGGYEFVRGRNCSLRLNWRGEALLQASRSLSVTALHALVGNSTRYLFHRF